MSCVRNIVAALFDIDLCKISTVVWFCCFKLGNGNFVLSVD